MEDPLLIRRLRDALQHPLPGSEYQYRMAHVSRQEALALPVRDDVRHAAVLILLFQRETDWHTVLIKRKTIAGDVHSGQISFPGGRLQPEEKPEEAALREAMEEIGNPPELVNPIGQLTSLHIPVSNHLVFPVVAYQKTLSDWRPQESEVDEILEVPLHLLNSPNARIQTSIKLGSGLTIHEVPSFSIGGQIIWGATAMILGEFTALLDRVK